MWNSFLNYMPKNSLSLKVQLLFAMTSQMPEFISTWIYKSCDIPSNSLAITKSCCNMSNSHALQMRAAASYVLGTGVDQVATSLQQLTDRAQCSS